MNDQWRRELERIRRESDKRGSPRPVPAGRIGDGNRPTGDWKRGGYDETRVFGETWRVFRERLGSLLISTLLTVPAFWLYSLSGEGTERESGMIIAGWFIELGGVLLLSVGAAFCMYVALRHLTGSELSGLALIRSFASLRLGKVVVDLLVAGIMIMVLSVVLDGLSVLLVGLAVFIPAVWVLLALAIILFALFAIVLVGVAVRWLVFLPAIVAENLRFFESLARSWELVKGRFWWVLWMAGVVPALFAGGVTLALFWIPGGIASIVGSILISAFLAVWELVVYLELRAAKIGLPFRVWIDELSLD